MDKGVVVMLVEGEALFGEDQIRSVLQSAGFKIRTATMAVTETESELEKPALIIVNLSRASIVDLDGCTRLAKWSHAPLIAIGPASDEGFRTSVLNTVADDYLVRPVNPYELAARVKTYCSEPVHQSNNHTTGKANLLMIAVH